LHSPSPVIKFIETVIIPLISALSPPVTGLIIEVILRSQLNHTSMTDIDREYEYNKPSWTVIIFATVYFVAWSTVLGTAAAENDHGITFNGSVLLSQNATTILFWSLCVIGVAGVAMLAFVAIHRLKCPQRIALMRQSVWLPRSRWSSRETMINYDDINTLSIHNTIIHRWMCMVCRDGKAFSIHRSLLAQGKTFDELSDLLKQRVENARQKAT